MSLIPSISKIYGEITHEYLGDALQVIRQIKTFEEIFINNAYSQEVRDLAKEILKKLYVERDEYETKAEFYRNLSQKSQISQGVSS